MKIRRIDFTCGIVTIELKGKTVELDFEDNAGDILISYESLQKIPVNRVSRMRMAENVEAQIRRTKAFRRRVHRSC